MTWREYHQSTKHTAQALRRTQHTLDWKNMPDPFRHYEGVPVLDLPADPPSPEIPALDVLSGGYGTVLPLDGPAFLSELLFHSAAISASKQVPSTGYRYALRVNPSSGNLHPTEFHFITRGLEQWPDGLYHYRPSSHMAEQRATGNFEMKLTDRFAPVVFVLTSIAWREAWKYRDRAYRYCLHDIGHAWQALALAARAMGCDSFAIGHFPDDDISRFLRLSEDEWPMLVVEIRSAEIPLRGADAGDKVWYGGRANQLSSQPVNYPLIDQMHAATKVQECEHRRPSADVSPDERPGCIQLPPPVSSSRSFGEVARARRSALDFRGGNESMSLAQLSTVLAVTAQPLFADFASARFVQLYLYAHRVDGLEPGVYRYWPAHARLEQIRSGDQRVSAAGLSLGQDLAGNACVAFSMIADLDSAVRAYGERGYRYVHFEAGAIGQRLYLAAEALGLGATGIGAFFDDEVHRYLNLTQSQGQVVYHFAIGHPIVDPRLGAG
jgi:SagB-type dehydrogenase family enzyme